mmetsp:Transcript_41595/g.93844  ORF Transcript_41595/g.93844 Transcript_41595/m.93844 type:complete len:203 (-) Transcript_41595:3-611(-)
MSVFRLASAAACRASTAGSRSIQLMNQPFSVSSATTLPSLPKYKTNSVKVDHLVEFMCTWCLSPMYSLYTRFACVRLVLWWRLSVSRNSSSNSFEYRSTTAAGFSAKIRICRRWPSEVWWHLKPFSSRHCFWHISQYHLSFWRPFAFMRFPIAFGVRNPPFLLMFYNVSTVLRNFIYRGQKRLLNRRAGRSHTLETMDALLD